MSYAQEAQVPTSHLPTAKTTAKKRSLKRVLGAGLPLLLLIAFLHNSLYALFLPPWGLIDEAQHFHYIQYIAEEQALPVAGDLYLSQEIVDSLFATRRWDTFHWTPPPAPDAQVMGLEGYSYEAYQPPLFYVAMAPLYQILPKDTLLKVYALRMVVVLLSLITVWAIYRAVGLLLPRAPNLPFLAGLLLVAIPERAIATSRINNDILLEIIAALFFLTLTKTVLTGITARRSLLMGLLVGLAAWSKTPGALLIIPLLLALWLRRHDTGWLQKGSWMLIVVPFGVGLAARNLWLYGDLTGFSAFDQLHRLAAVDGSLAGFLRTLISLPNHFWLVWWKGSDVGQNPFVTAFYALMGLVVLAGFGRLLLNFWQQRQAQQASQDGSQREWMQRALARIYALVVLLYAIAVMVSYYEGMVPILQGRFLLPALIPFVLLLTWGLWLYPHGEKIILGVVVILWGVGLFSLFGNLIPYFYYWSDVLLGVIPPDQTLSFFLWAKQMYHRALLDKPQFLAPLLIALPIAYVATLLVTFVIALRAIVPASRNLSQNFMGKTVTLDTLARYLLPISIVYLALPHLLFYIGWLQWQWAILATLCLLVALVVTTRIVTRATPQEDADDAPTFRFTSQHALMIGAVCLCWLLISGIGGLIRQDYDWDKHNVMLNSLIQKPWPTVYEIYQEKLPLIYYIGYYLPPALVGKVAGWVGANAMLFVWTLTGLVLATTWFTVLVRRVSYGVLFIFVFFSGLDIIGKRIAEIDGLWTSNHANWQHLEPWAGVWQYSSNMTLLFWVPNQALSGWILMGIIAYCLVNLGRRDHILLPVGLSAFWSPFVMVGIVPFLVIDFLVDKEPLWPRIRRILSLPNAIGLLALGITAFYLSARVVAGSPVIISNTFAEWSLPSYDGPIQTAFLFLILFCLLEFGLYAIVLYASRSIRESKWRWMLHITVFTLCLLPWFKFGAFNDLVMRASIPALFMLVVFIARTLHDSTAARWARITLVLMLLIGAATPAVEIARLLVRLRDYPPPLIDKTQIPRNFVDYFKTDNFFFGQYTGSVESPFFQYAAKTPDELTTASEAATNDHDYILYDNKIYLLRDEIQLAPEVEAGETFTVPLPLNFYGLAIRTEYSFSARVVEADQAGTGVEQDGEAIWHIDDWPNGRPPIEALKITPWTSEMTIAIPSTAEPGQYALQMGFYDVATKTYLPARSVPDELPLGEFVTVGTFLVDD